MRAEAATCGGEPRVGNTIMRKPVRTEAELIAMAQPEGQNNSWHT
jgi:hypothetical protein